MGGLTGRAHERGRWNAESRLLDPVDERQPVQPRPAAPSGTKFEYVPGTPKAWG